MPGAGSAPPDSQRKTPVAEKLGEQPLLDRMSGRVVAGAEPQGDRQPRAQARRDDLLALRPLVTCVEDYA